jgi:uncharacterized protein (TIGR03067 family)
MGDIGMRFAIVSIFMVTGAASAADDSDNKKFLKELEGAYKMTSAEFAGERPPPGFLDSIEKVTIKGNKLAMVFKGEGGKTEEKISTLTVDGASKPASFDIKPDDGPNKGQTLLGIAVVEGDMVKICFNHDADGKRPTDFKTAKGGKIFLFTLTKSKQ